ncbi:MAG: archaeosortase/exosortase family protein [Candidatus Pacearchaeota archaeon]
MEKKFPPNFKDFIFKSIIFLVLFFLIQILTMWLVADTRLPKEIKPFSMSDLAKSLGFILVLFIGINKKKILKIKKYSVPIKERIASMILIVLGFFIYFPYKTSMIENIELVKNCLYFFTFIEYSILLLILLCLIVFVFGLKFSANFFREFKKGLLLVLIGTIITYFFVLKFQLLWHFFSNIVGRSVHFLLSFIGPSTISFTNNFPLIAFHKFMIGIAEPCSGIDSILLFSFLFFGILAWEWKNFNSKKALLLFIIGVIGTFALNILRIFLLILIGAYLSKSFATNVFHTNASSVFFLIYFAIFWKLSYKWFKK